MAEPYTWSPDHPLPSLGIVVMDAIARFDLVDVRRAPSATPLFVLQWKSNSDEQLEAVIAAWLNENCRRKGLVPPSTQPPA